MVVITRGNRRSTYLWKSIQISIPLKRCLIFCVTDNFFFLLLKKVNKINNWLSGKNPWLLFHARTPSSIFFSWVVVGGWVWGLYTLLYEFNKQINIFFIWCSILAIIYPRAKQSTNYWPIEHSHHFFCEPRSLILSRKEN